MVAIGLCSTSNAATADGVWFKFHRDAYHETLRGKLTNKQDDKRNKIRAMRKEMVECDSYL